MIRHAFRLHRWGMIGYGLVVALSTLLQARAFVTLAGTTSATRAAFAHDMSVLAVQLSYLFPPPYRLNTLSGYVLWRAWGTLPIVVSVWAIAAATGAVRADEDRQLVDSWLAARVSRARLVASRFAAWAIAALIVSVLAAAGTLLGAAGTESIPAGRVAGQVLALWLFMLPAFGLVYLVAQIPGSLRAAQGGAAAVLLALYMLNAGARSAHALEGIAWISPYRWYQATDVLAPGGHVDPAGTLLGAGCAVGAALLSVLAFSRRDVRGPLLRLPGPEPEVRDVRPSPALQVPVLRLLYRQRWIIATWAAATVVLAVFIVAIGHTVVDELLNLPNMRAFLTHGSSDPYRGFISAFWFSIAQLLIAGLAVQVVAAWASDDTQGVLEAMLSSPLSRGAVVVERAGAALVAVAALAAAGSITAAITAAAFGITLEPAGVLRATLLLVPFALTFAAAGAVGTARWPRATVGALGLLAFLSYIDSELSPLLKLPDWVANLSVFQLYGMPLGSGVYWTGFWATLVIVVLGFAGAVALMQRRDVTR